MKHQKNEIHLTFNVTIESKLPNLRMHIPWLPLSPMDNGKRKPTNMMLIWNQCDFISACWNVNVEEKLGPIDQSVHRRILFSHRLLQCTFLNQDSTWSLLHYLPSGTSTLTGAELYYPLKWRTPRETRLISDRCSGSNCIANHFEEGGREGARGEAFCATYQFAKMTESVRCRYRQPFVSAKSLWDIYVIAIENI